MALRSNRSWAFCPVLEYDTPRQAATTNRALQRTARSNGYGRLLKQFEVGGGVLGTTAHQSLETLAENLAQKVSISVSSVLHRGQDAGYRRP